MKFEFEQLHLTILIISVFQPNSTAKMTRRANASSRFAGNEASLPSPPFPRSLRKLHPVKRLQIRKHCPVKRLRIRKLRLVKRLRITKHRPIKTLRIRKEFQPEYLIRRRSEHPDNLSTMFREKWSRTGTPKVKIPKTSKAQTPKDKTSKAKTPNSKKWL